MTQRLSQWDTDAGHDLPPAFCPAPMPMPEPLPSRLLDKMNRYAGLPSIDFEEGHAGAADLLIDLCRELADRTGDASIRQQVADILTAYEKVGKWYA